MSADPQLERQPVPVWPPLFPAGLKLRDNDMPLPIDRFTTAMAGTGHINEAVALRLMFRAWRETPVGTLPSDERLLREVAGLDRRGWKTRRSAVLRPFVMCSDGRLHCWLLFEVVARLVSSRAAKRAQSASSRGAEWTHFANWFASKSTAYAKIGHPAGQGEWPTQPDSFIPSIEQSVLVPRAREADRPNPTPTRPKDAWQEHEGQIETALPDNWQPSAFDIEAVKAARPDLDDVAIERQRERFIQRARGKATAAEWAQRFVAFAREGHGKPWSAPPKSSGPALDRPSNGHMRTSKPSELVQWRARLKGVEPGKPVKFWPSNWGPRPGERGCQVPRALLTALGFEDQG